ncbi:transglutaminase domain-containing protein [Leeuwenhoekiella palythoae]|uniref:transglutaminase domain-containing protein n=1 Tax=Leeuwenhoekiella palythoae TaxID=573501 RepID=UPI0035135BFA
MRFKLLMITMVVLLGAVHCAQAQKIKLDKVTKDELELKVYAEDSTAAAIYLDKVRETYFDYKTSSGFLIINEFKERIKILSKEGLDYATKKILSYKNDSDKERVDDIEGVTYNLVSGKIEEIELKKDGIFENERSENWDETSITMPAVQVGSIVEWSYTTISPFYKIDDLILQEDLPIVEYYAKIRTPGMFTFRRLKKGYFDITPKESIADGGVNFENAYGQSNYASYKELVAEYTQNDVPALKEEVFLINPDNYRRSIVYELISTEFTEGNKKEYATTWEEVAKTIFKQREFGGQMSPSLSLKKVAARMVADHKTQAEKIEAALRYVKSKIKWNGNYGKYTDDGIDEALKRGSGDVAEINLLLTVLLRECGVQANPVLIGTKQHGIPSFPTLEGYNYVVVGVRDGLKTILLDATDKFSAPNILPTRVYNWYGRMVNKEGVSQEIDLYETISPQKDRYVMADLNEDGSINGVLKQRYKSLEAFELRHKVDEESLETYTQERAVDLGVDEVTNLKLEGVEELSAPITESLEFKINQGVDQIPGQIYLNPLLFFTMGDNPFKSDVRISPVEFNYPFFHNTNVTLKLPEGYEVQQLPEPIKIALPGELGSFVYSITHMGQTLQVMTKFNLTGTFVPYDYYQSLKEFFNRRVAKETEKVILQKSI